MNSEHRRRIDLYCDIIVPKLNIMKLWPKLLENGIFNIDDINISTWKVNIIINLLASLFIKFFY